MRNYRLLFTTLVSLTLIFSHGAHADKVDRDWEMKITEKLAEKAKATEVLWLDAKGDNFLALYTSQAGETAHGAAIVLHAMGGHADWPQTIAPIRTLLPDYGWSTLSIQLPVVSSVNPVEDYGKTLKLAAERIKAAVHYLRERKFLNIVVVGHSFGAATTLAYLQEEKKQKVQAMVAIGLQDYPFVKPAINLYQLIEKTQIPILDIYGSRDFQQVIKQAPDRRLAAKKGNNKRYTQVEIEGADHYFNHMEEMLVKRIRGWLGKAAPGVSIMVDENFDGNKEDDAPDTSE